MYFIMQCLVNVMLSYIYYICNKCKVINRRKGSEDNKFRIMYFTYARYLNDKTSLSMNVPRFKIF